MRETRSAYVAHNALKSAAALTIARSMDLERTREDWRAVLARRDNERDARRERRAQQRGRVSVRLVAFVAMVSAFVTSFADVARIVGSVAALPMLCAIFEHFTR